MHNPVSSASGVRKPDIAVIGMSCRFPGASNYEEFWENLKAGKSGIEEVPANRWNWADYWGDPLTEKNKSNSKWGGFLKGVDHFDTDFFGMSVTEVERMDPQQRIMLELTWACLEDAGIRPASISGEQVGVFLGVFNFDYKEIQERGGQLTIEAHHSTGTASAIIANRVSYYFNFKGPSVPIDTACSSSLSAVHAAIQSLQLGECKLAVAGGINLLLTPTRHISFSKTGMLSPTGSCKSFDEGADGYVRGEGAGLVLLKPLEQALADKDNIYGIIKGSAVNHSGKTYSLTYPNPDAQKEVIIAAQQMAGITPDTIGYIEAHGTGTPKGDPIEFRGLTSAFAAAGLGETRPPNYCALGSVKSNVGHLEAAAGIAGIIKVLLSMRHQQLPALQNFKQLNHRISLTNTPFFLVTSLMPWEPLVNGDNQPLPRRAGVSSFDFGGTNATEVLEEAPYVPQPATHEGTHNKPPYYVVCLSAKTPENLSDKEKELTAWLENRSHLIDIADVCRTLSAGREHFMHRTVFVVKSSQDLLEKLQAFSTQADVEGGCRNVSTSREQEEVSALFSEIDKVIMQALAAPDISEEEYYRKLGVIAGLYLKGYNPDWDQPWFGSQGKRIGLPAYPFTKQGYWVPEPDHLKMVQPLLHPLLGSNTADLHGQRFTVTFTGQESFLRDHVVNDKRVLPAVAYLEMVRAAVTESTKSEGSQPGSLHLENMIWSQPIQVEKENLAVHTSLSLEETGAIAFSVFSEPDKQHEAIRIYCKGSAVFKASAEPALLDIERIQESCRQKTLLKDACYSSLLAMGFAYGPAHQCLEAVYAGTGLHLAKLTLPITEISSFNNYTLHPGIMDAALQTCLVIGLPVEEGSDLYLPFALDSMEIVQATTANMWALIRAGIKEQSTAIKSFDIDLYDAESRLCVRIKGFTFRQLKGNSVNQQSCLLLAPEWKEQPIADQHPATVYARRLVFLCEPGNINVQLLQEQMPDAHFIILQGASGNIGERYLDYTSVVFEEVKALLKDKLPGKTSVQVVLFQHKENRVLAGLSGLLKTAMLENPAFVGQMMSVADEEHLVDRLKENASRLTDHEISYLNGKREVRGWKEMTTAGKSLPWKKDGVYLITGGTGGLGMIFAKEIATKVSNPLLLLTGRSALNAAKETQLTELRTLGARVEYHQVDIGNKTALTELIQYARSNYAGLQGIIHSAGIIQDDYIIRKRPESIREVLSPKVLGATYLDELTHDLPLDFFILFSSVVGPLGNAAQADYAAANAYLDEYAAWRNQLVTEKKRHGHTISINWPLWKQGGMQLGKEMEAMLLQQMGMSLLETAAGIESLYRGMAAGVSQIMVAPGDRKIVEEKFLTATQVNSVLPDTIQKVLTDHIPEEAAIEYFKGLLSVTIKRPVHKIDAAAAMEAYGIDSIMVMQMTNQLETVFGTLPKTLFFEYQNIKELTQYFLDHYQEKLRQVLMPATTVVLAQPAVALPFRKPLVVPDVQAVPEVQPEKPAQPVANHSGALDIAIIGVAGRYPQADNLQEFWNNLQHGKDCITEIPRDRWDYRLYFDADKEKEGKTYSKWGGFINDVDKFDPLFFNISPSEAERMDPQERLFLQCVYETIEDAGYTKQSLAGQKHFGLGSQVGVYVGVMYEEYQLYGAQEALHGRPVALWGLPSSIANRVSYYFDLHGPSMAIDTMCSSSLTAIHLACESIVRGKCELAIAGGVNVSVHPNKYLFLSQGRFVSSKGRCESFGTGGDGYVPGEGVGAVLLKPLEKAIADGDNIYGVIKSTAINHGGKTNGYTVPNPKAQAGAISRAFSEAGIDARTISYLEAHGTGTSLGDPIEILGLCKAMNGYSTDTQFCSTGSVKSNIGHCESAAGIAGITKVLLQLKHRQIVPSLHSGILNANIDFTNSPFYVQQELTDWKRPLLSTNGQAKEYPLCAGISSFGAGGANAHIIIEEYIPAVTVAAPVQAAKDTFLIRLSATDENRLIVQARQLLAAIGRDKAIWNLSDEKLPAMAYTLQVGREQLECSLALPVTSMKELEEQLTAFINDPKTISDLHKEYDQSVSAWMKGASLQRISLPTYPFKKERYWIGNADEKPATAVVEQASLSRIHPLLHQNISDLSAQRFQVHFTGNEFYLADHVVNERKILPAVAQLEMARTAVWESVKSFNDQYQQIRLQQLVWTQPLVVDEQGLTVYIELNVDEQGLIHFEIYSQDSDEPATREIFSQGQAAIVDLPVINSMGQTGIHHLQQLCNIRVMDKSASYDAIAPTGLHYGPSLRGIEEVYIGDKKILARMALPAIACNGQEQLLLHPGIMDPALQTTLFWDLANNDSSIKMFLPFAMEAMEVYAPTAVAAWVLISSKQAATQGQRLLDIDVLNEKGDTCVRMKGVSFATPASNLALSSARASETVLLFPSWERKDIPAITTYKTFDKQVIITCGLPAIAHQLATGMAGVELMAFDGNKVSDFLTIALQLFEKVKALLLEKKRIVVQVLIPAEGEGKVYAGLAGLLKTARKESPNFFFQVISVGEQEQIGDIKKKIIEDINCLQDKEIRYQNGLREVLQWRIKEEAGSPPKPVNDLPWKDGGVYLITGGAGGLGLLFANEIVRKAKDITLVLTGRSSLDSRKLGELAALEQAGAKIDYRKVDITNQQAVKILIQSIRHEFGSLNGILHSAGVIRDNYLINKHTAEWKEVLAPKVEGIQYLDIASKEVALDFFVLFSSVTGALGNAGQADYATANAFMDEYATYRNELVAGGLRHGHTLSVNWPLWKEGGMQVDQDTEHYLFDTFGMVPLSTVSGIASLYRALLSRQSRVMIIEGDRKRIIEKIVASDDSLPQQPVQPATTSWVIDSNTEEAAILYFKKLLSAVIKLPVDKIRADTAMEEYGIDSVMVMKMSARLEKVFGALSKTLFFEYRNISELTRYFLQEHAEQLMDVLGLKVNKPLVTENKAALPGSNILPMRNRVSNRMKTPERKTGREVDPLDIAIVGVSGKYPQAENLNEFWENLCQGKDCITEIPADRWDYRTYFDTDKTKKGKTYSKWGGFLKDVAAFDALFFNISPLEAELLDPQERLFLQCVQETIEDAGYNRQGLAGSEKGLPANIGVYVGVMYEEYQLFGVQESRRDHQVALFGNPSSIANRISYFYNFDGPSMAVDTMCSSSLTAIHLACQSIHNGECKAAIAGGVNISIHPNKYLLLAQGKFISGKGRCESFGIGGDGYVPAEGVGAVLLKPLAQALLNGDHVYAVIKATAVNHGGRTNGYTVPNPQAQAAVISKACKRSGIDPRTISYLEAHGTGTSLGDPIEITGLKKAYQEYTKDNHFCAIGSVKSNIGHSESAAGMAGLTKILLQLKHKLLTPSLHSEVLNPHIDFANSPFIVQQTLAPWERPIIAVNGHTTEYLRRAGLSSFGAGGSNAHLIIEEFDEALLPEQILPATVTSDTPERVVILLSAKNEGRLKEMAARLEKALLQGQFRDHDLPHIAFTLQVGREALETRLAMIVQSVGELCQRLHDFVQDAPLADDVYYGKIERDNGAIEAFTADEDLREALNKWMERKKFGKLCTFWVKGLQVDWMSLYKGATGERPMRRISLPAYPFAPERYWVPQVPGNDQPNHHAAAVPVEQPSADTLFLQPWWKAQAVAATTAVQYTQHIMLFAGIEAATIDLPLIKNTIKEVQVHNLYDQQENRGNNYQAYSLHLFHLLQDVLLARPSGKILIQVIVDTAHETLTGLQALLKTAHQENPLITGQLIAIPKDVSTEALIAIIKENSLSGESGAIKYIQQVRHELSWKEHSFSQRTLQPFWKEGGRYLITGGAGGLGLIFAKEIVQQLKKGTVILTGRSSVAGRASLLAPLQGGGVTVIYKQADIANPEAVNQLIRELQEEFGGLDGIIHSAGITKDSFLIHKTEAEWQEVASPKIAGLINLDNATKALPLDCFIVFSSIAGALGNPGQADYAAANAFMDEYVQFRNRMVAEKKRHGLTISLNWPLWKEGGMQVYKEVAAQLDQKTGMLPLDTHTALQAFYQAVGAGVDRLMVLHGDKRKMQERLLQASIIQEKKEINNRPSITTIKPDKSTLRSLTIQQLKSLFGQVVKLSPERIDEREEFQAYGLNSVMIVQLNQLLEKIFGELSKTLFYEYQHLSSLTDYLVKDHEEACIQWGGLAADPIVTLADKEDETVSIKQQQAANILQQDAREPIAIIGMSGRYPMAPSLTAYWENLQAGKDCITEIPADRWSMDNFFQPDKEKAIEAGSSYSKWGGFLEGFAQFDPLFFNISPREANTMDPQERIFLQACWQVFEDAGYTRERIAQQYKGNVGVFAGVTKTGFELYGPALSKIGENSQLRTSFSSVANRVSWHLNLHGPSMPIDTMCSSSLIAIHEACESILSGACAMAIAGGVNLYLHPLNYVGLCSQSFLAVDGKCRSFGEGGSGFVPGEGVGAVLLKRLSQAIADGDTIYALVKGSGGNHGGKTSGYTVPNPMLQAALIRDAFDKAGVQARDVSYIEAHGTGTSLGDPIEITGLSKAFQQDTADTQFCAIGSVKSNIGHLEAAAGIAGITKIVLQMKHRLLVPSLHAEQLNTNINFNKTPFYVQRKLTAWEATAQPRIAGISSFGAGGSNAHVIIEEYIPNGKAGEPYANDKLNSIPAIILLSARNKSRLKEQATQLLAFVNDPAFDTSFRNLLNTAYTLQTGREAMEVRWGVKVNTLQELQQQLRDFTAGKEQQAPVDNSVHQLLSLWIKGDQVNWDDLYTAVKHTPDHPVRINLPAYPFEPATYWLPGLLLHHRQEAPLVAPPPVKEWLFTTEEWTLQLPPATIDWNKQLKHYAGKRICIVYHQEQEADQLIALLEKLEKAGGLQQPLFISKLAVQQISAQQLSSRKPELVLFLGPGKLANASVQPVESDLQAVYQYTQCLMQAAWDEPVHLYYFYETTDTNTRLDATALSGLFRSAMKENAQHVWKSVQLHNVKDTATKCQLILKEWLGDDPDATRFTAVQYKEGQRFSKELVETSLPPAPTPAFRKNGNYIIAGGMGYIGSSLLEELANKYQANLAILSRGPYDEVRKQQCEKLRKAGANVYYHVCDITNMESLRQTYMKVKQHLGTIHGVINLARKHDSKSIMSKTWESFYSVSQVKIQGTINLDIVTQDENLDLFMLFASIGAYGARGDADYAFSVAFQNAFAAWRNTLQKAGKRTGVAISQCWGPWEEDRLFPESRKKMKALGLDLINMAAAFPLIEASCHSPHSILGLCTIFDREKVKEVLGMQAPAAITDTTIVIRPTGVNGQQPGDTVNQYEQLIIQWEQQKRNGQTVPVELIQQAISVEEMEHMDMSLVERVYSLCFDNDSLPAFKPSTDTKATTDILPMLLKAAKEVLQTEDIEETKPLQHYGLDSILAMRLSTNIAKKLTREVMPKWLIEFPTLLELSQHLAESQVQATT